MENNNKVFKISRGIYGDSVVTYNGISLVAVNKLDIGASLSFNWGDTGIGSEALAYAILVKVGESELANRYAKLYTKDVISKIQKDDWTLDAIVVVRWINENTHCSIDESAFQHGHSVCEYEEQRHEDRRKEERRIQREKDFQEEAQRRLKVYESKLQERRQEERRVGERRISGENDIQEKSQKNLEEIQAQYQDELNNYKKQIIKQNTEIEAYQRQLKKYKLFIDSLDIKSMYDKYRNLDN